MLPSTLNALVLLLTSGSSVLAIAQMSTPVPDTNIIGQVERLGLVGILILIVIILWRKLESKESKDEKLITAMMSNIEALKAVAERLDKIEEKVDNSFSVRESLDHKQRR